jgi:hypothetical protein
MLRSPPIDLPHTSQKIGTHPTIMAEAFSIHDVVVAVASEAPVSRLLREGRPKHPSPPDGRCPTTS